MGEGQTGIFSEVDEKITHQKNEQKQNKTKQNITQKKNAQT